MYKRVPNVRSKLGNRTRADGACQVPGLEEKGIAKKAKASCFTIIYDYFTVISWLLFIRITVGKDV